MQLMVIGMHRSGTSVLARLLNLMGVYFGAEGVSTGANRENPKGFWERRDVRNVNDAVLHSVGCDWDRVSQLDIRRLPASTLDRFRAEASRVVLDMDAHRPWLLKEPRFCLLLPLWMPLLEVPVCIFIVRHPVEVAASLKTRNGIPIEAGLALWQRYNHDALAAMAGLQKIIVSHASLMRDPLSVASKVHGFLVEQGLTLARLPAPKEILAFVDEDLHRERHQRPDLTRYADAPQCEMYERILRSADPELHRELVATDDVHAALVAYEATSAAKPVQEKMLTNDREALKEAKRLLEMQSERVAALEAELSLRSEASEQMALGAESARQAAAFAIDECRNLRERLEEVTSARVSESEQLAEIQKKLEEVTLSRDLAVKEAAILKQEIEVATRRHIQTEQKHNEELRAAKHRAALSDESNAVALARAEALAAEMEAAISERFREIRDLTRLLVSREGALESLEARLAGEKLANKKLNELIVKLNSDKAELADSIVMISKKLEAVLATISTVAGFLEADKSRAQVLARSLSWRATAPLRRVRRTLSRQPRAGRPVYGADVLRLHLSDLFDRNWYLHRYVDVERSGMDPIVHYLAYGADEGRDPGPNFRTEEYYMANPDVRAAGMNPLVHFLSHGMSEGRGVALADSAGSGNE